MSGKKRIEKTKKFTLSQGTVPLKSEGLFEDVNDPRRKFSFVLFFRCSFGRKPHLKKNSIVYYSHRVVKRKYTLRHVLNTVLRTDLPLGLLGIDNIDLQLNLFGRNLVGQLKVTRYRIP